MNNYPYSTTLHLEQNDKDGPVHMTLTSNPEIVKHTIPPESYVVLQAMFTSMQVNLIQEGVDVQKEPFPDAAYKVNMQMGQNEPTGEIFTSLELNPINVDGDPPLVFQLASSYIVQLLEEVGIIDSDGMLIGDGDDFHVSVDDSPTVH